MPLHDYALKNNRNECEDLGSNMMADKERMNQILFESLKFYVFKFICAYSLLVVVLTKEKERERGDRAKSRMGWCESYAVATR